MYDPASPTGDEEMGSSETNKEEEEEEGGDLSSWIQEKMATRANKLKEKLRNRPSPVQKTSKGSKKTSASTNNSNGKKEDKKRKTSKQNPSAISKVEQSESIGDCDNSREAESDQTSANATASECDIPDKSTLVHKAKEANIDLKPDVDCKNDSSAAGDSEKLLKTSRGKNHLNTVVGRHSAKNKRLLAELHDSKSNDSEKSDISSIHSKNSQNDSQNSVETANNSNESSEQGSLQSSSSEDLADHQTNPPTPIEKPVEVKKKRGRPPKVPKEQIPVSENNDNHVVVTAATTSSRRRSTRLRSLEEKRDKNDSSESNDNDTLKTEDVKPEEVQTIEMLDPAVIVSENVQIEPSVSKIDLEDLDSVQKEPDDSKMITESKITADDSCEVEETQQVSSKADFTVVDKNTSEETLSVNTTNSDCSSTAENLPCESVLLPPPPPAPLCHETKMEVEDNPTLKPEKVKSRWRRSSELEIFESSYSTSHASLKAIDEDSGENSAKELKSELPVTTFQEPQKPASIPVTPTEKIPTYEEIDENVYLFERRKCKSKKEVRRMICDCSLTDEERVRKVPGCGDDCLNRLLMIECGSRCPTGDSCINKRFQKKQYAKTCPFKTLKKGWGLLTVESLPTGTFVMEYVGEVLTAHDFRQRVKQYARENIKHYYFMALKSDEIIDATVKGSLSRFINHSCDPNCETQKWTVNGELRIGFFTTRPLRAGEELTFDYQFQRYGKEAQKCYCESKNCRGYIGAEKQISLKSYNGNKSITSKRKKYEERKRETVEDVAFEEEIDKLRNGLRNREHTLLLARLMVRADDGHSRSRLLDVIQNTTETACLRLFLDYHGLSLMWSWMADIRDNDMALKHQILNTLQKLPVPNKSMLIDSKIMSVVERWSFRLMDAKATDKGEDTPETDQSSQPPSESGTPRQGEAFNDFELQSIPPKKEKAEETASDSDVSESQAVVCSPDSTHMGDVWEGEKNIKKKKLMDADLNFNEAASGTCSEDKSQLQSKVIASSERDTVAKCDEESADTTDVFDVEKNTQIKDLALKLLDSWSELKEVFRIPRLEKQKRREDEREADRRDRERSRSRYRNRDRDRSRSRSREGSEERDRRRGSPDRYRDRHRDHDRFDRKKGEVYGSKDDKKQARKPEIEELPKPRKTLLPTPPRLSKEERRQLFAMEVQQKDQEDALRRQQDTGTYPVYPQEGVPDPSYVYDPNTYPQYCNTNQVVAAGPPLLPTPSMAPHPVYQEIPVHGDPSAQVPVVHAHDGSLPQQPHSVGMPCHPDSTVPIPVNHDPSIPPYPSLEVESSPSSTTPSIRPPLLANPPQPYMNNPGMPPPAVVYPPSHPPPPFPPPQQPPHVYQQCPPPQVPYVASTSMPPPVQPMQNSTLPPNYIPSDGMPPPTVPPVAPNYIPNEGVPPPGPSHLPPPAYVPGEAVPQPVSTSLPPPGYIPSESMPHLNTSSMPPGYASNESAPLMQTGCPVPGQPVQHQPYTVPPVQHSTLHSPTGQYMSPQGQPVYYVPPAGHSVPVENNTVSSTPELHTSVYTDEIEEMSPSPPPREIAKPIKLPPFWKSAKDPEGNVYYYHSVTRITQWDPPSWDEEEQDMDLGTPTYDEPKATNLGTGTSDVNSTLAGYSVRTKKMTKKKPTTAAADTSSEAAKRYKEMFRSKMSSHIVQCLNPYRKPDCKVGRICSTEDFKHLARKLTHFVMAKELKHCKNVEDLECNENVKHKAKDYIQKYMAKYGPVYKKDKSTSPKDE